MKRNQSIKHQSPGSGEAPNSKLRSGSRFLTLVGSVLLALAFGCAKPRTENSNGTQVENGAFFVATNGNDGWSGKLASPNRSKMDGPFATVAWALRAVRGSRSQGVNRPSNIVVRGGFYFLDQWLVLGPEDSGTSLVAYRNEKPILSGGRRIGGWKEAEVAGRKLWAAEVPEARDGKWFFRELWINGRRAKRARHPNHGYFSVAEAPDATPDWTKGQARFRFREGDLKNWAGATNAEVVVMDRWVESRLPILRVDEKERMVTFGKRSVFQLAPGDLYYVEHVPDILDEQSAFNEIANCDVHDGGKMFPSGIGIWIGQSPNNRITHNLIHDFYYTGISIGWTWGYGPSLATNNLVAFNDVHHIGVKSDGDGPILSDMGGIYTLGKQAGTKILNNLWHDMAGVRYGGWGIYFDEGSSGILAASNVVYRTTHGGFHQHYGETNLVRNNIFAFGRDQQLQRTRNEPHISFSFETNIVYFDSGALLSGDWSGTNFLMDWNLYFDARPIAKAITFGNSSLKAWREGGYDRNSVMADPLFIAPKENDFRLRPDSPALRLGFEPIDLRQVGIEKNQNR